jgi:MoxR-like ATPase
MTTKTIQAGIAALFQKNNPPGRAYKGIFMNDIIERCRTEMAKRIAGQKELIDGLLAAVIAGGHALLEGAPGLGKTLAVKTLAEITALDYKRIQFTPDLLPADHTGTHDWEQQSGDFRPRRGPVFSNIVLADEINRAPAKVQSALLEAMEEKQVTIGDTSYPLPSPFITLATQNPIEHEGTYPLPEAELDRFLLKILVSYPSPQEEGLIAKGAFGSSASLPPVQPVLGTAERKTLQEEAAQVTVDERIAAYMVRLVTATRPQGGREGVYRYISLGASPRGSIALYRCAQIEALFQGRNFVTPEDVKRVVLPVLRHRIMLSYEAEADGLDADAVLSRLLQAIPLP